ncbi:hypothetical protein TGRUB_315580 [Toxoplasma gondii RUB]|uniref:Alpha/beta hydrolase family protein n=1 Tax=Toxoplasma gondii RUB TaxID=935652 RepID=A0A086MBT7_TOXGO|nr:hypothetical protein TGRUB_315580 [Toxoplasma gondii RUB]
MGVLRDAPARLELLIFSAFPSRRRLVFLADLLFRPSKVSEVAEALLILLSSSSDGCFFSLCFSSVGEAVSPSSSASVDCSFPVLLHFRMAPAASGASPQTRSGSRRSSALTAYSQVLPRRQPRRSPFVSADESEKPRRKPSSAQAGAQGEVASPAEETTASTEFVASAPSSACQSDADSVTAGGETGAKRLAGASSGRPETFWSPMMGPESVGSERGRQEDDCLRLSFSVDSSCSDASGIWSSSDGFQPPAMSEQRYMFASLPSSDSLAGGLGASSVASCTSSSASSSTPSTDVSRQASGDLSVSISRKEETRRRLDASPSWPPATDWRLSLSQRVVHTPAKAVSAGSLPARAEGAAGVCTPQKRVKPKRRARSVRACPLALGRRRIPTKPTLTSLESSLLYKYRAPAGPGIQVPALRLESAPTKLSNWQFSWQELLCYNPRAYSATPLFEENYLVMRAGVENFLTPMTDLVFVDRNSAHLSPAYVYHAYLIPPVCPHEYHLAACIQCYTSDDSWLSRGAWRRVCQPNGRAETLRPTNPLVLPFRPSESPEEKTQFHFQFQRKACHPLYQDAAPGAGGRASAVGQNRKLPLHLWILLGGKDMQALDGIVLAWKFLRFASEIPPSEFVEGPGEATAGVSEAAAELPTGALFWGESRCSGQKQYFQYHSAGRHPSQDQTCESAGDSSKATGRSFSPFGPFLYDMDGVSEDKKYRLSFLMVDIPGYGNSSGHPAPETVRSSVLQAVKHALMELVDHHGEESIVVNILGYSLGCAVALALAADLAESLHRDLSFACVRPRVATQTACSAKKIATAAAAWEERMRNATWEEAPPGSEKAGKPRVHSGVAFDQDNLTLRDTCNVTLNEEGTCVVPLDAAYMGDLEKPDGLRLAINRLILLAPFTSIQAMASRVAAATVGGGGFISRAASALVSRQINWDNEASMKRLFEFMGKIKKTSQSDVFRNFRLYIQHGDKDSVIPWTMGFELFTLAKSLRSAHNMPHIPLKFSKLSGETHATVLSGPSELPLLESCFSPYRLHPAAPLALLKFYSRLTRLPSAGSRRSAMLPGVYGRAGLVRVPVVSGLPSKTIVARQNTVPTFSSLVPPLARSTSLLVRTSQGTAVTAPRPGAASERRLRHSTSDGFLVPQGLGNPHGTGSPEVSSAPRNDPVTSVREVGYTAGDVQHSYSPVSLAHAFSRAASGPLPSYASELTVPLAPAGGSTSSVSGGHPLPPVPSFSRSNTAFAASSTRSAQTHHELGSHKPPVPPSKPGCLERTGVTVRSASLTPVGSHLNGGFVGN